jgi:FAD/FMN-containing dehydrogenase
LYRGNFCRTAQLYCVSFVLAGISAALARLFALTLRLGRFNRSVRADFATAFEVTVQAGTLVYRVLTILLAHGLLFRGV